MRSAKQNIFIGTSGWVYKEWANDFYRGLKPPEHFRFYVTQFPTVEINATFYRLPDVSMVHGWRKKAPPGFIFSVKGSRFITHIKRLNDLGFSLARYFRRIQPLKEKTGPFLWQLPPNFQKDLPRLQNFLKRLPGKYSHAIEFRHASWVDDDVKETLRSFNCAWVCVSSMRMPADFSVTADFVYVRFHGLSGGPRHDYTKAELQPWADFMRAQAGERRRVYAYFNNDLNVRAPNNAKLLMEMCRPFTAAPLVRGDNGSQRTKNYSAA